MKSVALLLSIAVLISGCVDNGEGKGEDNGIGGSETGAGAPVNNRSNEPPGPPEDAGPIVAVNRHLQLDGCVWLQALYDHPLGTNPTPVPEGWNPDDSKPFSSNVLRLYQCKSVALDELDRSASLLIETSNAGSAPAACRDPDYNVAFLVNLFTDDEALAQVLSTRYHAPAKLATFTVATDETGTEWTWSQDGVESSLMYPVPNVEDRAVDLTDSRIIWNTPNGTNTFEVQYSAIGPNAGRAAAGTLAPFHYLGVEGHYAGAAGAGPESSLSAKIRARGPLCEELDL